MERQVGTKPVDPGGAPVDAEVAAVAISKAVVQRRRRMVTAVSVAVGLGAAGAGLFLVSAYDSGPLAGSSAAGADELPPLPPLAPSVAAGGGPGSVGVAGVPTDVSSSGVAVESDAIPLDIPAPAPAVLTGAGRVRIPALDVDAPVTEVRVRPNGELEVPPNSGTLGWWADGARPGRGTGSVVVDGHVTTGRYGRGALYSIGGLAPGEPVEVVTTDGTSHTYRVTSVVAYPKEPGLPSEEIFSQEVPERLVLVTCGGAFDARAGRYSHNVVAYADPA